MDLARFRNSPAGRVVGVGQGDARYWAFVPNPLPPELPDDPQLAHLAAEAAAALGELAAMARGEPAARLLAGPFLRREAVLSSRVEGNRATVADLYAFEAGLPSLRGVRSLASEPDVLEALRYLDSLEHGLERLRELPISLRLIRELHELLMRGTRAERTTPGEFRRSQNWVGDPGCTLNEAAYVPPPVHEMHEALDALEKYVHAEDGGTHQLVRLALIHYQLEAIHPFLDGNGRVGRMLITLLLADWGLLSLPLLDLSGYFELLAQRYRDLLMAVSRDGAWAEWVAFFLTGVAAQSREALARARELLDMREEWRARLSSEGRATGVLLKLVDALFASPVLTVEGAQRLLGVTPGSARRNVERLVGAGILRQAGGPPGGEGYVADDLLRAISARWG